MDIRETGVTGGNAAMLDAFLEEVGLSGIEEADLTRLGLRLDAEGRAELGRRLQEVFEDFVGREPAADGEAYSVFLAVHRDAGRAGV